MKKRLTKLQIEEIDRLSNTGYSLRAISKKLDKSKSTIYYYTKRHCHKMTKFYIDFLNEQEKGYLIGLFIGDGSFNKGSKTPRFFVRFALDAKRDKDIALRIKDVLLKAGKKSNLISFKSNIIVKTCSKQLVFYINKYVTYENGSKMINALEPTSTDFKYGLIAGLIDSDGHVHKHLGTEIKTVSTDIFKSIIQLTETLNIKTRVKIRNPTQGSFSNKQSIEVYFPSKSIKFHKKYIPSVKIARYLS